MKSIMLVFTFIFIIVCMQHSFCKEDEINARVVGITVIKTPRPTELWEPSRKSGSSCTEITFLFDASHLILTGINASKCVVEKFMDDKGKSLISGKMAGEKEEEDIEISDLKPQPVWNLEVAKFGWPASILATVRVIYSPSAGANSLHFKGKVILQHTKRTGYHYAKDIKLARGEKFVVGENEFEIVDASQKVGVYGFWSWYESDKNPNPDDGILHLTLKSDLDPTLISSIDFSDKEFKSIKRIRIKNNHSYFLDLRKDSSKLIDFLIFGKHDKANINIEIYKDIEEVEVPIDIEVGLGLEEVTK